nr:hypothetical protein CFP56_34489 [Quercus suber]
MKNPSADEPSADSDQTPTSKRRIQAPILTKPRRTPTPTSKRRTQAPILTKPRRTPTPTSKRRTQAQPSKRRKGYTKKSDRIGSVEEKATRNLGLICFGFDFFMGFWGLEVEKPGSILGKKKEREEGTSIQ